MPQSHTEMNRHRTLTVTRQQEHTVKQSAVFLNMMIVKLEKTMYCIAKQEPNAKPTQVINNRATNLLKT